MSYGIDVSHHQNPSSVPWEDIAKTATFCICRASYGSGLRDRQVVEHVRRARAVGLKVGLYQFFRPTQAIDAHLKLFKDVAESIGYGPGDVIPWLDIERDPLPKPGQDVNRSWSDPARRLCEAIGEAFGDCGVYITQREWNMLGAPSWVLARPLWVAHYTNRTPATPGGADPVIHQHRVGPYDPNGPGGYFGEAKGLILDQNMGLKPLPLIESPPVPVPPLKGGEQQFAGLPDDVRAEIEDAKKKDYADDD